MQSATSHRTLRIGHEPGDIVGDHLRAGARRRPRRQLIAPQVAASSSQQGSQDVVLLGVGLIATISALVPGLLIAAAKSSFDTQSGQVKQITADIIVIDNLIAEYGPMAQPFTSRFGRPYEANAAPEKVYMEILALTPQNETQKALQSRAIQLTNDLAQTRLLVCRGRQRNSRTLHRPGVPAGNHLCELQPVRGA
jgi:hypothetical protein